MAIVRREIIVRGIVQGVGFRPFVYRLAVPLGLAGSVQNKTSHVRIALEGDSARIEEFIQHLQADAPTLARIEEISIIDQPLLGDKTFSIIGSASGTTGEESIFISPDVAICVDCQHELLDVHDRRYRYPFINCTNCGPRFSIVTGMPYDRPQTTMRNFPLCPSCQQEYDSPADRRYHAQPTACAHCGPEVMLATGDGNIVARGDTAVTQASELLRDGAIIAIKGLGGYHLACDALNPHAVHELRKRKARDEKPFAVMAANLAVAKKYCTIDQAEIDVLCSSASPIVLLRKSSSRLPNEIAPGNPYLGVMLPYTPLHLLLFQSAPYELLIMTSGNISGEPVCFKDDAAFQKLDDIADYILYHNREINTRVDDSVVRVLNKKIYPIRRSRGYVPLPVTYQHTHSTTAILATGGHLKNTFCLNRGGQFFLSHHIGDLENMETLSAYESGITLLEQMLAIQPTVVAHDLHPNYLSTQYAVSRGLPCVAVQHHRAHVASCMVDNNLDGEVIGVAFDGTGYGDDGRIWGGEFFVGGLARLERIGHLEYVRIPGGDSAIADPWKCALGYLYHAFGSDMNTADIFTDIAPEKLALVQSMLTRNFNVYQSSSAGRLFDAVAAIAGIRHSISFEGQAAIELEQACARVHNHAASDQFYPFDLVEQDAHFSVTVGPMVKRIVEQVITGHPIESIAMSFHETIARVILDGCRYAQAKTGLHRVVLSGGVFQNMVLLNRVHALLAAHDLTVYLHHQVPANDGGLSLGQAALALETLERSR